MTSKLHVKVGSVELDFEGESEFLKSDILPILNHLLDERKSEIMPEPNGNEPTEFKPLTLSLEKEGNSDEAIEEMSINTIATKLNVKSQPDLVIATCAYLKFIENRADCPYDRINEAMKLADHYYTSSHSHNLSHVIARLIKAGKLIERKNKVYSLPQNMVDDLKGKLKLVR